VGRSIWTKWGDSCYWTVTKVHMTVGGVDSHSHDWLLQHVCDSLHHGGLASLQATPCLYFFAADQLHAMRLPACSSRLMLSFIPPLVLAVCCVRPTRVSSVWTCAVAPMSHRWLPTQDANSGKAWGHLTFRGTTNPEVQKIRSTKKRQW